MKKIFIIVFIIICIVGLGYMIFINAIVNKNEEIVNEYIPEMELSDEESRKTIVTLYFENEEEKVLKSEARLIDSKELLREPYITLIGMLIEGPKDSTLKSLIPKETKILETNLNGNCIIINFSRDFIDKAPESIEEKTDMIYSIVNTLTELKEIEKVKFLINGEDIAGFEEESIKLEKEFTRKK